MAGGPRPLRRADLLARLGRFGIETRQGRGSHIVLIRPVAPGGARGPTYPVSCHTPGAGVSVHIVRAILRRFGIPEEDFW